MLSVVQHREICEIFHEIFQGKKILHHYLHRRSECIRGMNAVEVTVFFLATTDLNSQHLKNAQTGLCSLNQLG